MAFLPESSNYEAGIYQLETTDEVLGGVDGKSNTQGKQLANRTKWLKDQVDTLNGLKGKGIPLFSVANSYSGGDQVIYQKNIWRANTSISPGAWNPSQWARQLGTAAEQDVSTPPQFDNDTSLATTEFVQRALGSNSGSIASTASLALTDAHAGKVINCYSTAQTLTLPAASSVPMGTCFYIFNSVDVTINAAGADLVYTGGFSQSSLLVKAGDCVVLSQFTNSQWLAIGGAAGLKNSASFGSSLAANGYQKLPSGLIIQWGSVSNTANNTSSGTFPISFPNASLAVVITGLQGTGNHQAYAVLNSHNLTGFAWNAFFAAGGSVPVLGGTAGQVQGRFIAVGY